MISYKHNSIRKPRAGSSIILFYYLAELNCKNIRFFFILNITSGLKDMKFNRYSAVCFLITTQTTVRVKLEQTQPLGCAEKDEIMIFIPGLLDYGVV